MINFNEGPKTILWERNGFSNIANTTLHILKTLERI